MGYWGCTRVTGPLLEDSTYRNTPPNGVGRTGALWTGEFQKCPAMYRLVFLCRVVTHGIELFRVRYPGLAHYFHTKKRMWDNNPQSKYNH